MKVKFSFLLSLISNQCLAIIDQEAVMQSALKHYPTIIQARENIEASRSDAQAAKGAFDTTLKSRNLILPKGYYVRRNWDTWVEKPVGFANSKVFAGYMYGANGIYPTDLSLTSTNSGGTPRVGLSFSALRNFNTDPNRARLKASGISFEQSKNDYTYTELQIKRESLILYWSWIASIKNFKVFSDLTKVAEDRDEVLNKRASAGDISKVVVTENNQYVARRKSEMANSELNLRQTIYDLSLYYRDENANPIILENNSDPDEAKTLLDNHVVDLMTKVDKEILNPEHDTQLGKRPDLLSLGQELQKIDVELALNKNNFLPLLDVSSQYERYLGTGSPTNAPHVWTFIISLEIPLEYNLLKGQKSSTMARKRSIASQYNFLKESVQTEVSKNFHRIRLSKERMTNARDEVKFATELLTAENYKFDKGGSNLFLINIREENLAHAKSNHILSQLEFIRAYIDYKASTVKL